MNNEVEKFCVLLLRTQRRIVFSTVHAGMVLMYRLVYEGCVRGSVQLDGVIECVYGLG